ncbi:glycosyl hydrolase family 3 N terminal domain-containing protein [Aspergillus pseudoustus]|uniref:Probable beta-glucosidase M n=1 Tax=Aspergillus pseudoustus TaxID=1810923 RepID=A0ABR4KIM6_9EURO
MWLRLGLVVALQLAVACCQSHNASVDVEALENFWSYGRSDPVYPSPQMQGWDEWAPAYHKAKSLVQRMTNEEKNNLTYGYKSNSTGCSGISGGAPRVGFPGICLQDAGNGVRATDMVNAYASGIHAGASWNRELAYARAYHMGTEFRRKGVNVALGPVAGPLGRIARGGRNWEGFSNDPYLAGALTGVSVRGLQKSVIACVKHLIGNEQETNRMPPMLFPESANHSVSSNIDDKTMHELYLWPFQDAVRAGAGSAMCSYQRINNSYGCQNSKTMNGLLKGELGFQGFVVSDWEGQHTGVASAAAGLDLAMPDSPYWANETLSLSVANGSLAQAKLDDMATRIIAAWYKYAPLDNPGHGMPANVLLPHAPVDARGPESKQSRLQSAVEGHVLVKNLNNTLPLRKPKFLSLFGYDAVAAARFSGRWMGLDNTLVYPDGTPADYLTLAHIITSSADPNKHGPGVALNGTLISGGGSGSVTPAYIDAPFNAIQRQAYADDTFLAWDFVSQQPLVNQASEACIVFINEQSSEGWDRPYLANPYSDELVENVARQCRNTIVVIHNAGVRLVDRWIENSNVTAVLYAHLPGQDSGAALVQVLYGKQSPSGRLPYTVARKASDYGHLLGPEVPAGDLNLYYPQSNFTEGVYIDYKAFEAQDITPRFEFGFGLTYSSFVYSQLSIRRKRNANLTELPPGKVIKEGGLPSLWDVVAQVSCVVSNVGEVEAAEVAQLYVGLPGGPKKVLRGFEKQSLRPGQRKTFSFDLTRRDLSTWDVDRQSWVLQRGEYSIYVGKSVLDIQLTGSLRI